MAGKQHHFVPLGHASHKGFTWLRMPNVSAHDIWKRVKSMTQAERNSLIMILIRMKHPAAPKLQELQRNHA